MPIVHLIAALALSGSQASTPRLRTLLPNGAVILVENMPEEKVLSVQLWASARNVSETSETHGHRHLLEHLVALGSNRDLDIRLESEGAALRARTYRDAMQIEVIVPKGKLSLALAAIREVLAPLVANADQLAGESKILGIESTLRTDDERLSAAAWSVAYGPSGLDPLGSSEAIQAATPAGLENLRRRHFSPDGLALVIAGPISADEGTRAALSVVKGLIQIKGQPSVPRPKGLLGSAEVSGSGEARAAPVPSFSAPETAAVLAAALAIGTDLEDSFVTYTPTTQNGLILVGSSQSGIGAAIDVMTREQASSLFPRAKVLAQAWVTRQLGTPSGVAGLRGMLLCQGVSHRPESLLDNAKKLTHSQFLAAFDRFRQGNAVHVGGSS